MISEAREMEKHKHAIQKMEEAGNMQFAFDERFAVEILKTGRYRGEIYNLYTRTWEEVYYEIEAEDDDRQSGDSSEESAEEDRTG